MNWFVGQTVTGQTVTGQTITMECDPTVGDDVSVAGGGGNARFRGSMGGASSLSH